MTPEQAIEVLPGLPGAHVRRQLADGPTATTWLLQQAARQLVLTCDKPLAAAVGLDRAREFRVLQQLVPHQLAPEPFAVDAAQGLLAVMAVPGTLIDAAAFHQPATLASLGELLARLHRLPIATPQLDLAATLHRYAQLAAEPQARSTAMKAEALLAALPRSGTACLCHNDIHPANLIRRPDGAMILLDWEYAAVTDPRYELAVVAEHNDLAPEGLAALLVAYQAAGGQPLTPDQVQPWRPFYHAIRHLWQLAVHPPLPVGVGSAAKRPDHAPPTPKGPTQTSVSLWQQDN